MTGKIVNSKIVLPPVNAGNKFNVNLNSEWLKANGFHELTAAEIEAANTAAKLARTVFTAGQIINAIESVDEDNNNTVLRDKLTTVLSENPAFSIYWSAYSDAIDLNHAVTVQALASFTEAEINALKLNIT